MEDFWIETENFMALSKFKTMLSHGGTYKKKRGKIAFDWLWIELGDILLSDEKKKDLQEILRLSLTRSDVSDVFLLWNSAEPCSWTELSFWKTWAQENVPLWQREVITYSNTECGGALERSTIGLIFTTVPLPKDSLSTLDQDGNSTPIEDHLDPGNFIYSDYLSTQLKRNKAEHKDPSQARISGYIDWVDDEEASSAYHMLPVFDPTYPAPDITLRKEATHGDIEFCITTCDLELSSTARPIRRHELFSIVGFSKELSRHLALQDWNKARLIARQATPRQTVSRIVTTLLATRQEHLNQEYHFTQAVGNFETTIVTEDNLAFFCGQEKDDGMSLPVVASPEVINEWTTLPMPTNEHWKQALMIDHDIAHVITRMEQQLPPLYAALINKSYYSQWSKGKFEVEDGILFQWEQPKGANIRQLRRRVVPESLRLTGELQLVSGGPRCTKMFDKPFRTVDTVSWETVQVTRPSRCSDALILMNPLM
jgi:hypothetical protein